MVYYEVTLRSGERIGYSDPDDMRSMMLEENDLELLDNPDRPFQFDVERDIKMIKNLGAGDKWLNRLATVECIEDW